MTDRLLKISEQLRMFVSECINEDSNRKTLITVTHVSVSRDLKNATVFISVFPESQESAALDYLKRRRPLLRAYVMKHATTKTVPFFEVELDLGEKHRQQIDSLLQGDKIS